MDLLVHLPLLSLITSFLPLLGSSRRFEMTKYARCTDSQREEMYKMIPERRFHRFFEPDCKKRKFIFRADTQGCLGALRWLQELVGPSKIYPGSKRPLFKLIICSHRPCSKLPLFRRCGSNQKDHSSPRTFRNGCRQCAISCKAVLAGNRRYKRLDMNKCPNDHKHTKTPFVESSSQQLKTKPHIVIFNKTTVAPTYKNVSSTSMQSTTTDVTTMLFTTELMTTELVTTQRLTTPEIITYQAEPVEKTALVQHCVLKQLKSKITCPGAIDALSNVILPELPPWKTADKRWHN